MKTVLPRPSRPPRPSAFPSSYSMFSRVFHSNTLTDGTSSLTAYIYFPSFEKTMCRIPYPRGTFAISLRVRSLSYVYSVSVPRSVQRTYLPQGEGITQCVCGASCRNSFAPRPVCATALSQFFYDVAAQIVSNIYVLSRNAQMAGYPAQRVANLRFSPKNLLHRKNIRCFRCRQREHGEVYAACRRTARRT